MMVSVNLHRDYPGAKSKWVKRLNPERSEYVHCTLSYVIWYDGSDVTDWRTVNMTDEGITFYVGRPTGDDIVSYTFRIDNHHAFVRHLETLVHLDKRVSYWSLFWYVLTRRKPAVLCTLLPYYAITGRMESPTLNELEDWANELRDSRWALHLGNRLR